MSRLVKSYLTSGNGEPILRIHPVAPKTEPYFNQEDDVENLLTRARQEAIDIVRAAQEEQVSLSEETNNWVQQQKSELAEEAKVLFEKARRDG
ncbi:MAG: hypothetical protein JWN30_639, partial [Bacilli bacterium]|nr:hypothetical protein [Bacilli bacterium]